MAHNISPDISVIIPTYNVATYIKAAITSALTQKGVSIEIIMIDDKSSDDTVAIAKSVNDPRLEIIELSRNGGPSVARNKGFEIAKGEWIAVLDGDDVFEDGRLTRLLVEATKSQADIIVDNLNVYREDNQSISPMFTSPEFQSPTIIDLAHFIRGNQLFLGGYALGYLKPLFKSTFLKSHGLSYSTDIHIGEDYLLMAECLAKGAKCVTCPQAGYRYTVRAGSISHRLNQDAVSRIENADKYFISKYPLTGEALVAQTKRTDNLKLAFSFTELVDAIKGKKIADIIKILISQPICIFYLWRPIATRIKRLMR